MNTKLGLQLWSVRNSLDQDFEGTLERIAEIGYKNLQVNFFGVSSEGMTFGKNMQAPEMRKQLDQLGLRAVSAHFLPTADMRMETIAEDLKVLGADTLAIAIMFWSNQQEVIDWCYQANQYGETLKRHGIQLYYHNHWHEFQVFNDQSIFEIMIEGLDKELVRFEFDTYWAVRGGQDPIYWMKKLGSRCNLIHQKDLPAGVSQVNLFERFGYDAEIDMDLMMKSTADAAEFTEVGEGVLNIPGYIRAARQYNQADTIFVEQDLTTKTEMESIALSFSSMSRLMAEK